MNQTFPDDRPEEPELFHAAPRAGACLAAAVLAAVCSVGCAETFAEGSGRGGDVFAISSLSACTRNWYLPSPILA